MEQAKITSGGRHSGWSAEETSLLWETADEALRNGLPLKQVFERIAEKTGRRPNSIRNYYYAQARAREGEGAHLMRFVPFTEDEVRSLVETVLRHKAQGQSVRACLQGLSGGDHSLMLRYQNKYRAVIKSRPEYVREMVERLNGQGVECDTPTVNHRVRADVGRSCERLEEEARRSGDAELARACDVIAGYLRGLRLGAPEREVLQAAQALVDPIKEFVARSPEERVGALDDFCDEMVARVGALESRLPLESAVTRE